MSIKTYQENQLAYLEITELNGLLLDKAALHMEEAIRAIENQEFEKRAHFSDLACDILRGLQKQIVKEEIQSHPILEILDNYYNDINIMILRMNIKNDLKAAQKIAQSFRTVAGIWRYIGRQQQAEKMEGNAHTPYLPSDSSVVLKEFTFSA